MADEISATTAGRDVYEVAYLAGGPARVIDTAVVTLMRSGRVRVHAAGQLIVTDPTRGHPVEAAVLDAIGPTGHRTVDTVRWRLEADQRIGDLARRLQQEGLLRRRGPLGVRRRDSAPGTVNRAGRRLVARLRDQSVGTDEVWRVALGGRAAMLDERLRAAIFEPPRVEHLSRAAMRAARKERAAEDPVLLARHTFGPAVGGAAVIGLDGGGWDGGAGGDG
jgi:hypothetical protein